MERSPVGAVRILLYVICIGLSLGVVFSLSGIPSLARGRAATTPPKTLATAVTSSSASTSRAASSPANTFVVDTTADTQDATPGNGTCADANGMCSLRAAITEANASAGTDEITLPAGNYTQTLAAVNENANAGGDLDITSAITINGAGSATTIIQASETANTSNERVFHLLSGKALTSLGYECRSRLLLEDERRARFGFIA
jgi:CSLREA domain-containing protein